MILTPCNDLIAKFLQFRKQFPPLPPFSKVVSFTEMRSALVFSFLAKQQTGVRRSSHRALQSCAVPWLISHHATRPLNSVFCIHLINHNVKHATTSRYQNYTTHRQEGEKLVLGIETSCDDTGIAIVSDQGRILAEGLSSHYAQMQEARGVVPHLARREHESNLGPLLDRVMRESGLIKPVEGTPDFSKLSAIAVTAGPGIKPNISICGPST